MAAERPAVASPITAADAGRLLVDRWRVSRSARPAAGAASPLSPGQRGIWLFEQIHPGTTVYNVSFAAHHDSPLDPGRLTESMAALVRRHPALRTTFRACGADDARPQVHEELRIEPEWADLRSLPAAERERESLRLAGRAAARPFELSRGPLARLLVCRLADDRQLLVFTAHHIVCDGGSLPVVLGELGALYAGVTLPDPPPPPLPRHATDRDLRYWRSDLADLPDLDLPDSSDRGAVQAAFQAGSVPVRLPADVVDAARQLGRAEGATLFMVLLAAFELTIGRYSGQEDFAVGVPEAGRDHPQALGTIGLLTNPLPVRADLTGRPSFRQLIGRCKARCLAAFAHRGTPFEDVVSALAPGRDPGRPPLFQAHFAFHPELPGTQLADGELRAVWVPRAAIRNDIELHLWRSAGELTGSWDFAAGRISQPAARRMTEQLVTTLRRAAAEPDVPVGSLPLLTDGDRELLRQWSSGPTPQSPRACLHDLVTAQCAVTPDAVAVRDGSSELTYRQLDRQANQLAHRLQAQGVTPESIVGIRMGRSIALAVAMLGILKAGAAYLPLDPAYPAERIDFMCRDSGVHTTITSVDPAELASSPETSPRQVGVRPDNLAYVLYTSGSTGRPKGVMLTHRNAVELVRWGTASYTSGQLSQVLAATSICFDLSVFEFFVPLAAGGTVVIVEDALALLEPGAPDVTLVNTVPSAAREIARAHALPPSAQVINLAGEALSGQLVADLHAAGELTAVYNLYGPSEDTTYSTGLLIPPGEQTPPIGTPLPHERAYVLDAGLRPVPVGAVGELFLGGCGLARGYLGRPGLTAGRFVPDPFGPDPGARLYRTGDLVRYRDDGTLVYLGRRDHQVKLRGRRIELGEIEACLQRHPAVREAVASVHGEHLVAYAVTADGKAADLGAIAGHMRSQLPGFMVPQLLIPLAELPRTPNGKVDRKALPAPDMDGDGTGEPPRGAAEELVAAAWREALGLDSVYRQDNFFDVGGHSLLAGQVITRLRERTGSQVPLRLIFERPVLADFAAAVADDRSRLPVDCRVAAQPIPRLHRHPASDGTVTLPVSAGEHRLWFLAEMDPAANAAYVSQAAIWLDGNLRPELLEQALALVAARHETLRSSYHQVDDELRRAVSPTPQVSLQRVRLNGDADAARLALEAAAPFDLAFGPLLRAHLGYLRPGRHLLLLTLHHIICDGWSMAVLGGELSAAYSALLRGQEPELPELSVQYADFAAWQNTQQPPGEQLEYWRQTLAGLPRLDLPADRPRPRRPSYRGDRMPVQLGAQLAAAAGRLARDEGATEHMVLLAAWQVLLGQLSGQHDFGVGTVVAGRQRSETERLIGFFVNTLVLRADLSGPPTFRELLRRVRTTALDAYSHQDVPFDQVVASLRQRDGRQSPLYQASFTFQNTPVAQLDLPDITAELADLPARWTVSDLGLSLWPRQDGLHGWIQYATDLFEPGSVGRLAGWLPDLLQAATRHPDTPLPALVAPWAARPARAALVREAAARRQETAPAPAHEGPEPASAGAAGPELIHEAVARWARERPDAIAVECGPDRLSYAELATRSRRLAGWLRARGVGPERVVALDLARTPELLVAVLAIWQAGGAFLPLDCEVPAARRQFMIDDCQAVLTLTDEQLVAAWAETGSGEPWPLDGTVSHHGLSHVMYTSGTTGTPKGVLAEHAQLMGFLSWAVPYYMDAGRGAPLQTPVTFDLSFAAMFAPLMSGRTVTLIPIEHPPGQSLPAALAEGGFSFVKLTPSQLALLDETLPGPQLPYAARRLVVAGEELSYRHLAAWARHAPDCIVVNEYGPTETVVGCCRFAFAAGSRQDGTVPIGQAAPGTRLLVLDGNLEPVSAGDIGELYIAGIQVARGYLNQPGLTARSFLPDPDESGGRMYRTGDLVRELPDGNLVFLGRRDSQIKLRGYRIELGEIEHSLSACPGVARAAVAVHGTSADRMLVGYVTALHEALPGAEEIRAWLRHRLPEHMVPAVYVTLDALPLLPTGKLDRGALPAPEHAGGRASCAPPASAGPEASAERDVAEIWRELLHRAEVRPDDDFFQLGGHSLLATAVVARLRRRGYPAASLRMVFDHPALGDLAAAVSASRSGPAQPGLPIAERRPGPEGARLADASPGQERIWVLSQLDPGAHAAYVIQGAVHITGPLRADLLDEALRTVARRHETLRTTFRESGGRLEQVIHAVPAVRLEHTDLDDETGLSALAASAATFDLCSGPLLRVHLAKAGDDQHILLLTVHHIIADGWSLAVLSDEVSRAYAALRDGKAPDLPELTAQYTDYAAWQREARTGPERASQLDRCCARLAGLQPLNLHADRTRPPMPSYAGAVVRATVPAAAAGRLRSLAADSAASPVMVLLAAFLVLLHRHSNQRDIAVGLPAAGRGHAELERLVGFFVNTVVLRARLAPAATFADLLGHVRAAALDTYADQDVPFEDLLARLQPERDSSRTPLFQVMFNYLNQPTPRFELPGLAVRLAETPRQTAKFDLELYVEDRADGGLGLALCYAEDLYEPETAAALLGQYQRLLDQVATDPGQPLTELRLADHPRPGPGMQPAAAADGTICDRFARLAARHPDRAALCTRSGTVTYRELERQARQLAGRLEERLGPAGAGRIGVLCEQGADVPVALLGILASGRAYVPMDPAAPERRAADLCSLAQLDAIVADQASRELAEAIAGPARVIDVRGKPADPEAPWPHTDPADPAYVLFTSGSTGTPKGVVQSHRNVVHFATAYTEALGITPADRLTLLSAPTFDAAVLDVYGALLSGASCCPIDLRRCDPGAVRAELVRTGATIYHSTPTVLRQLAAATDTAPWPGTLRAAVLGGEQVLAGDLDLARGQLPSGCLVVNLYGSTECTLATMNIIAPGTPAVRSIVPIGCPADGVAIRLLGDDGRLAEFYGEMVCVSPYLCLGYLDPQQTAERFAEDNDGYRYRTGDMAWRLPDGSLEFAGRRDGQIKLRGHRIEIGEIESRLRAMPEVRDAAVVAAQSPDTATRLVAYVDGTADPDELRAQLHTAVPHYLVPSMVVPVAELPTTHTGKVDRSRLPAPDWPAAGRTAPPATPAEQAVASALRAVLGIDTVGRQDNFFDLGGQSLQAAAVVGRLSEAVGVEVPLRLLFERPVLADLAAALPGGTSTARSHTAGATAIRPRPRRPHQARARRWRRERTP
jgi:amino acid adenylation domain-containing protein